MPGPLIVTATDAKLFWLAKGLVLSLAGMRERAGIEMVCFDLGLEPGQAAWLRTAGLRVLPPEDPMGIAGHEGFRPYMLGQACRPCLPDLLPGHDAYLWLDADTWQQEPDGIGGLLHVARHGLAACCPELHCSYLISGAAAPGMQGFWRRHWSDAFGEAEADRLAPVPMLNSGVFAAAPQHALWAAWKAELRLAMQRPLTHYSEQLAFCRAVLPNPRVERLPALWNWLPHFARPRWNRRAGAWVEPCYPHQRLRIVHLGGEVYRRRYLADGLLFARGAYLAAGDLPEGYAPPPPVQDPDPRATDRDGTP